MADPHLYLAAPLGNEPPATCRTSGCPGQRTDQLGFCAACRRHYDAQRRKRMRATRAAIALIRAAHPRLFALLDRIPPLGDELAGHLAAHALQPGRRPIGLPFDGLDDFLRSAHDGREER